MSVSLEWVPADDLSQAEQAEWIQIASKALEHWPGNGSFRFERDGDEWGLTESSWGIAYPDTFEYRHGFQTEPARTILLESLRVAGKPARLLRTVPAVIVTPEGAQEVQMDQPAPLTIEVSRPTGGVDQYALEDGRARPLRYVLQEAVAEGVHH